MSSTSTLLKGIYLRPSVQPLGFSEQTSVCSLQAGSTSLQAGSRSLQADTGSPQTGSASFQSDPGLPFTATRHRRFLQFFHMKKQKHTSQPDPALEQDHEPGQDPASEQEYAQVAADAQRRKQAQIPTRARTIHDAIRREQLPSLFAELFNAVLFGGRSYIKMEDINSLPDFPSYLMRSSRFGVDLFLLDFTAIVSNYDLWLLSSSLSGRRFSPVIVLALYDSEMESQNRLLDLLMTASAKDPRIHLLDIQEPDFANRVSPSLRALITGKQTTYTGVGR